MRSIAGSTSFRTSRTTGSASQLWGISDAELTDYAQLISEGTRIKMQVGR